MPTLVLATGHGMVAPAAASQRIAARIPGAAYRQIGHSAGELPAAVAEFVLGKQVRPAEGMQTTMAASTTQPQSFAAGRYVVSKLLGEGGQKVVYLARDTQLERDVAVAVLKAEGLDEASLARLKREARALAHLEAQPHIVAIYDIGEHEGRPFTVCEYLAGGNLEQELARGGGGLPVERAVAIAQDVCRALVVAHGSDIIHRDIKPSNIWLTASGNAKLGDFGLATALGRTHLTQAGTIMGTATYMAPEQALGNEVDQRSDIYSLGCVLYEMLARRPPFEGDSTVAVVYQHIEASPAAISELQPGLPPALERVVLRMLAKAPEDRPQTATEVLTALEAIAAAPGEAAAREERKPLDRLAGALEGGSPMAEREVRYCTTEDGVRIAYAMRGTGPLVVVCPQFVESFSLIPTYEPTVEDFFASLETEWSVVLYDCRCTGMSQREGVESFTADGQSFDLEAVVHAIGGRAFALIAWTLATSLALRYVLRRPGTISRLIVGNGGARLTDSGSPEAIGAFAALARANWPVAAQTFADTGPREEEPEKATRLARIIRDSTTGDTVARMFTDSLSAPDITPALSSIDVPTLVMHHLDNAVTPVSVARSLAATIPNARLVLLPGRSGWYTQGNALESMQRFLAEGRQQPPPAAAASP